MTARRLRPGFIVFSLCLLLFPRIAPGIPPTGATDTATTSPATPPAEAQDILRISPGRGGFVSTWLKLGPFAAPDAVKNTDTLESWSPFPPLDISQVRIGNAVANRRFELFHADTERIGLKPKTGTFTCLVGIIESPAQRDIYLSSASTDGIQVFLNGERLLSNHTHKRWVRRDVNLTSLRLKAGDNLLVIRLYKEMPGRWSTYLRFMNNDFERAHLVFRLPGAAASLPGILNAAARLSLKRHISAATGTISIDCWLVFIGARPLLSQLEDWQYASDTGVPPQQSPPLNLLHPRKSQYLLQRFEGLANLPGTVRLHFNGVTFTAASRIHVQQVQKLFDVAHRFSGINREIFPSSSIESIEWRIYRLATLLKQGDTGYDFIAREMNDTDKMVAALEQGVDPYANKRNQLQRRGYRSKADGALHEYALYVPQGWKEDGDQKYSMIVSLHGLGGHPVKTLSVLFGNPMGEDETREDRIRFPGPIGRAPMFVLAPEGFGSSGYYALGERDVLDVMAIVKERYRIDENRIYITGASMGGTGAARIPLHYPDLFAAAVPLCGYHNMRYYSQVRNQPLSDVESYLLDVHSNISWVENGSHIPMYIVHGTLDQPRSSQDLEEYYKLVGNSASLTLLEDTGHNVWDDTYQKGWIFRHFARMHRNPHPRHIRFKTANLRYRKSGWLRIEAMTDPNRWSKITGQWNEDGTIEITTENIHAFSVLKDDTLLAEGITGFAINGVPFDNIQLNTETTTLVNTKGQWQQTAFSPAPMTKKPGLAGPIGDIQYDSLLFVYGTLDPWEGTLAQRIIGHLKTPKSGMTVKWKVKADVEVTEQDLQQHSIVIVGTPTGNALLNRIQSQLPIQVHDGAVVAGNRRFTGNRTAASFIYPNPLNPERYVLVHTGVSREAIYYTGHLPDMIPDYVIYDATNWGYTEGYVLGDDRSVLASGFFDRHWHLDANR